MSTTGALVGSHFVGSGVEQGFLATRSNKQLRQGANMVVGGLPIVGQVVAGEQAKKAQAKALKEQEEAQKAAQAGTMALDRKNQQALNRANQKRPDVSAILASMQRPYDSPTMLSGGTNQSPTMLGG